MSALLSQIFFASKSADYEKYAVVQQKVADEAINFAAENAQTVHLAHIPAPLAPISGDFLWLDLGSGTGFASKNLSRKFKKVRIISSDISFFPLKCAQGNEKNAVCCDFDELAFCENSFDGIISCSALQWSKDIERALRNAHFSLKKGKFFILAIFGGETLRDLRVLQEKFGIRPLVKFHTKEYLDEILRKVGFCTLAEKREIFSQTFENGYAALKSISQIGAAGHTGETLSPKILKDFVSQYEAQILQKREKIVHEYETFFYILEKK